MNGEGTPRSPITTDQLVADLKTVVRDAEALLKATADETSERIQEVRARVEQSLKDARTRLDELEEQALRRAQEMAQAAETYVRENPWQSIGIAAGIGLVLGLLFRRR
ncbi:MAG: DUF883 family protein [Gammaproteobacteria bacterium]|nr:DUF883 domain-containing protein [Gammaproteobacteria bacterium]